MKREHFTKVVEEALDSLPQEFRSRIQNVAVLVEDVPPNQPSPEPGQQMRLLLGVFHGVPTSRNATQKWGSRKRGSLPNLEPICPFLLYHHGGVSKLIFRLAHCACDLRNLWLGSPLANVDGDL